MRALAAGAEGRAMELDPVVEAVRGTLRSNALDAAFKADAILAPSEALIAERVAQIDPDAIHQAREALRHAVGSALLGELTAIHARRTAMSASAILAEGGIFSRSSP